VYRNNPFNIHGFQAEIGVNVEDIAGDMLRVTVDSFVVRL
jgi:hypothetical protein